MPTHLHYRIDGPRHTVTPSRTIQNLFFLLCAFVLAWSVHYKVSQYHCFHIQNDLSHQAKIFSEQRRRVANLDSVEEPPLIHPPRVMLVSGLLAIALAVVALDLRLLADRRLSRPDPTPPNRYTLWYRHLGGIRPPPHSMFVAA